MKEINFSEARRNFAVILQQAADGEPVTVIRRGHSSAVIISASEFMGGKLPKWTKSLPI